MKLADINSPMVEEHLRRRLGQQKLVHRKEGICELGIIKPTTVHQEFRVLRRIFAVAVKKRMVTINPCRCCRISGPGERTLSAALHDLVRADQN
jgi:hypothetical protein